MRVLEVAIAVLGAFVASHGLAGQSEAADVHVRNECQLAGQALRTGHPAPHWDWAVGYIRRCEQSGPETLVFAWTDRAPRERDARIRLAHSMRFFPTDRMLSTVHATAENESAARDARLLAIDMSVGFVDPETTINDLFTASADRIPGVVSVSHAPKLPTVTDVQGERRRLLAMLRRIRDCTTDPLVRDVAHRYLVLVEN